MRHHVRFEQWVPFALSDVFDFFANPENLPPLMPAWQDARIERASVAPPPLPVQPRKARSAPAGVGSRMLISFRLLPMLPVRMVWDAEIAAFAWDDHFCDVQLSGPFGYWRHCHRVRAEERAGVSGTVVEDELTYAFPFGVLGDAVNLLGGALQVRSIFRYRQKQLLRLLPERTSGRA